MSSPPGKSDRTDVRQEKPAATLRQRAEAMMAAANSKTGGRTRAGQELALLTPAEVAPLVYELEVHQIELELQNEELRATQVTLEAAQERYFDLYNLAPVGYVTVSSEGSIVEANLSAAAHLGVPRSRLVGQRFTHFIQPEDQDVLYLMLKQLAAENRQQSCELRIRRQDGVPVWARLETVAERENGRHTSIYRVTISDISDRKLAELLLQETNAHLEQQVADRTVELQAALADLQRTSKLKDEFMAMISHELRTPLTGVLNLSEMLEEQIAGPLNDRQAAYVKGIVESGERLLHLINGILGYTHLLSGKVELQAEPCELAYLLAVCAASQQHKAAAKGQTIVVQVEPPDLAITSDATAITEVLKRLLDNSVKFTPDGGQIGLEAQPTPRASDGAAPGQVSGVAPVTVDLVVWDTGIGIAADQQQHVFHAFTQADGRLERSHEGIGMGLAYVDLMVRLLGGTLRLESTPGEGSRFTITLPAVLPAPS